VTTWLTACAVLIVLGLIPTLWVGARGDGLRRLVALEMTTVLAVLALMAFSRAVGQSSYLIVPLVLVVSAVAGTLVFTRLLGPRP
jgi:multisubunit Na+/H+ antiporter MnhF subunit